MSKVTRDGIGGVARRRNLHVFFLVDNSGSMHGQKIQTLNWAIREVIPELEAIEKSERIQIYMRAIRFGDVAEWHIGPEPVPLDQFQWIDLDGTGGYTSTAQAINLLCEELDVEKLGRRNVPPVCILISDGWCTDPPEEYEKAINRLNSLPWGKKAVRLSIGIDIDDKDGYNKKELDAFISPYLRNDQGIETLHADSPRKLAEYIKTTSTTAVIGCSRSSTTNDEKNPVIIPSENLKDTDVDPSEVF